MHDFSIWLRTGFNPADIYLFQSHTGDEDSLIQLVTGVAGQV